MDQSKTHSDDYDPPRFWWTRRIAWGSLALIVSIVVLWGSSAAIAQYRLDKLIASYRAAGEPVLAEDFDVHVEIPSAENAAAFYARARDAYIWPASFGWDFSDFDLVDSVYSDTPGAYADEVERFISTNAVTIEHLQKAADCTRVEWREPFVNPLTASNLDNVMAPRRFAKLLSTAIGTFHQQNRDGDALDLLYAQVRLAGHRSSLNGSLLDNLVVTSIARMSHDVIENIGAALLTDIRLDDDVQSRKRLHQIISGLLDNAAYSESFQAGLIGERIVVLNLYETIPDGKPISVVFPGASRSYMLAIRPTLVSHCRRVLESVDQVIAGSRSATYPMVMSDIDHVVVPTAWRGIGAYLPDYMTSPSYGQTMRVEFTRLACRRMAAIALAVHMYELDHGHRPEVLQALVPDYLKAIPRDPFFNGDRPVRYLPDADPPVLYCVGPDGIDDGGLFGPRESDNEDSKNLDVLFFLDGDRPRPNP
ncbi:MAG: hypothetical protein DHS20C16_08830 [Phycisphaerae bacterium]|nr:MAG: hypothetical protein DHS20C16_08830 [Phycisphaerae bacterium]